MMVFISMFGFIGVAVLIFLWSQSSHEFGAPPLIFRLVGSCIALAFIAFGFGLPMTAFRHRPDGTRGEGSDDSAMDEAGTRSARPAAGYRCPHCGAGLGKGQDVSPGGDVKCGYCHKWWNIHAAP